MKNRAKIIPIAAQIILLKKMFPDSIVTNLRDKELVWKQKIRPSPLSAEYEVKMHYKISGKAKELIKRPHVYVVDPLPLPLAKEAKRLPHVYDQKKQKLCLYFPDGKQWNPSMPLALTVVWWIYEWLYHYELWLQNGEWKGGGVHPPLNQAKIEDIIKNNKPGK